MKNLTAAGLLAVAIVCSVLLWLTPYHHTKLNTLPVRTHRLTGRTEVLYPFADPSGRGEVFRWIAAAGRPTLDAAATGPNRRDAAPPIPDDLEPVTDVERVLLEQVRDIRRELDSLR